MSNAPETIWASNSTTGECVISFSTPSDGYSIEYRRADLVPPVEPQAANPQPTGLTLIEIDGRFFNPQRVCAVTSRDNQARIWFVGTEYLEVNRPIAEVVALLTGKEMNHE
jgi:hypothetical protein